ncbi:MAG TPA: C40 family peptidase [Cryptosporangiaceae bacterium]|nr:C40 family peptidase [Cryptosporangiaceae bacterium]
MPTPDGELSVGLLPRPGQARPVLAAVTPGPPILQRIAQEEAAVRSLSERVNDAATVLAERKSAHSAALTALTSATATLTDAELHAAQFVRRIYRNPDSLPTDMLSAPTVAGLALVVPGDHPIYRLAVAQNAFHDAAALVAKADTDVRLANQTLVELRRELTSRGAALQRLKAAHAAALAAAQRARDARNTVLGQGVGDNSGRQGTPATRAVNYALAQLGKPYVWGAEGPDTFDCSGLVQTAYATAGVRLPRTARPQYRATPTVSVNALLPGDLLFFATDKSNWDTIHHVGIYIGKGKMVHAPTTGDVVKISPVWWEEFFAATRVVPGVSGPAAPIQMPPDSSRTGSRPSGKPSPNESRSPSRRPSSPKPSPSPESRSPKPSPSSPSPSSPPPSSPPGGLPLPTTLPSLTG